VVQSAPLNGQELLHNIEEAAQTEVQTAQATASAMSAQADAEEAQLKSNRVFAGNMATEVSNDAKELDVMEDEEQKTIADAEAIEGDSPADASSVQDIEQKDLDAEQKSQDIQSVAEKLDASLLAVEAKLKSVGIESQRAMKQAKAKAKASLGDSPEFEQVGGSFKSDLQAVEGEAQTMVQQAQKEAEAQTARKQELDEQAVEMNDMAKTGMQQLKKAETQLHRDLSGNKDSELEKDIETEAKLLETRSVPAAETMSVDTQMQPLVDAADTNSVNFAAPVKKALGESPLEAAMAAAEAAENTAAPTEHTEVPQDRSQEFAAEAVDIPAPSFAGALDTMSAEKTADYTGNSAPAQDGQFSSIGNSAAKAIEHDAEKLVTYQQNSINEIKQIREPLT